MFLHLLFYLIMGALLSCLDVAVRSRMYRFVLDKIEIICYHYNVSIAGTFSPQAQQLGCFYFPQNRGFFFVKKH